MKNKTLSIMLWGLVSISLLLIFGLLQERNAKFLALSSQWIFISILPIVVALFVGGYITKFKGFGVELETALKESVSTSIELKATDAISDIPGDEKQSMSYLQGMSREKALSIKWLVFELGRTNYYSPHGIREYLMKLPNIEFLEVRTEKGQFVCYIPISYFKREGIVDGFEHFDMEKIHQFIDAMAVGSIREKFSSIAISVAVKSSDSLVQVLKTLRNEHVNMAAVISENNRYLGVLFSHDVERKVADAVLRSQSA
jgi:hypothetical protein